ncbi:aspartic proteinase CDR1-like [Phalaenopsis equestris]|uniref:aspartic proteinase CDR1-like n=1 Tax=Phalaenopsis equestris TaxID=78828 RepID=UPI0009E3AED6|nr:aspartic proteinase CDR1-like [Phalaenopsis equestris]
MASPLPSFAIRLLILSTTCFLPLLVRGKQGFSIDLIHRDSPKSPLSVPDSTPPSRLKAAADRSFIRASYFLYSIQNIPSSLSSATNNLNSEIRPDSFEYLMRIYVGSPPEPFLAIADTGSDLIWIQCKPCKYCFNQTNPDNFDPQASSTYKKITCDADICLALSGNSCDSNHECAYNYNYAGGFSVNGSLASETLSLDSTGGRLVPIPSIMFGCTHYSKGTFVDNGAGLVGLGGGRLSLIQQLGSAIESKFSYCLPSFDIDSATSRLHFGSNAVVHGYNSVTTPLIPGFPDTFYFLSLDRISVEGQGSVRVSTTMPDAVNQGNIIIDSGTTLTLIDEDTLKSVEKKVASSVSFPRVVDPIKVFGLCFNVSGAGDDAKFPAITFEFSGGAPVVLPRANSFFEVDNSTMCLGFVSSKGFGVNIFGNIAQQNFHIGYDLRSMELTIAPADCANL